VSPEEIARSIEGVVLSEQAGAHDAKTAPRIVYAHASDYAVPSGDGKWTPRNRLILGIGKAGVVRRWEIDTDDLIASSGRVLDAHSLRAAVSRLYAEGGGSQPQEPQIYPGDAAPAAPSPGPGDPELDL
jgi:hypothetical protein